jgi:hypothetical protein
MEPKVTTRTVEQKGMEFIAVQFRFFAFHNLPPIINTLSAHIIFANDTSVIISNKNLDHFCMLSNRVAAHMNKWFAANKLALNLDKKKYAINL